jgi:hypothetical protein
VERQLQIAEVVLGIDAGGLAWAFPSGSNYGPFEVQELGEDVHVCVHWQGLSTEELGAEVFSVREFPDQVQPNWCLCRDTQGRWALQMNTLPHPVFRQRVGVFQPDFRRGDLYVELVDPDLEVYPYPLAAPLDRILFINLVTHGLGLMLHACGIAVDGKGYIFAGPSDVGKTTLARLWSEFSGATILGDECLIVRRKQNRFWVYGTPWVGEAGLFSPLGVPVERVFFVDHDQQNLVSPISAEQAVKKLLAQSILTPYDAFAVESGLDFGLSFVSLVPAYEFGFVPDRSAVRFLQRFCGHV